MVLAELGQKIAGALRSLATKTVIDQGESTQLFEAVRDVDVHFESSCEIDNSRREPGCAYQGNYDRAIEERC